MTSEREREVSNALADGTLKLIPRDHEFVNEPVPIGKLAQIGVRARVRANFHAGGAAQKTELTDREQEICARIGPELKERGLVFVGIDVIGDYLTEINVTSPTGIQEINRLSGTKIEADIWDAIEARRAR